MDRACEVTTGDRPVGNSSNKSKAGIEKKKDTKVETEGGRDGFSFLLSASALLFLLCMCMCVCVCVCVLQTTDNEAMIRERSALMCAGPNGFQT